jgi:hypothetical protein
MHKLGRMTKIFTFVAGQSCRSALNSWAAQQRRPTEDVKVFVLHPLKNAVKMVEVAEGLWQSGGHHYECAADQVHSQAG